MIKNQYFIKTFDLYIANINKIYFQQDFKMPMTKITINKSVKFKIKTKLKKGMHINIECPEEFVEDATALFKSPETLTLTEGNVAYLSELCETYKHVLDLKPMFLKRVSDVQEEIDRIILAQENETVGACSQNLVITHASMLDGPNLDASEPSVPTHYALQSSDPINAEPKNSLPPEFQVLEQKDPQPTFSESPGSRDPITTPPSEYKEPNELKQPEESIDSGAFLNFFLSEFERVSTASLPLTNDLQMSLQNDTDIRGKEVDEKTPSGLVSTTQEVNEVAPMYHPSYHSSYHQLGASTTQEVYQIPIKGLTPTDKVRGETLVNRDESVHVRRIEGLPDDLNAEDHITVMETMGNRDIPYNTMGNRDISSDALENRDISYDALENRDISYDTMENRDIPSDALENRDISSDALENRDISSDALENRDISYDTMENRDISSDALENRDISSDALENRDISSDALENRDISYDALENRDIPSGAMENREIADDNLVVEEEGSSFMTITTERGTNIDIKETRQRTVAMATEGGKLVHIKEKRQRVVEMTTTTATKASNLFVKVISPKHRVVTKYSSYSPPINLTPTSATSDSKDPLVVGFWFLPAELLVSMLV